MKIDPTQLDVVLSEINKSYKDTARKGNSYADIRKIPTGSLSLDYATAGGLPMGRMCRFFGGPSSGKSLAAWNIAREAQRMGLTVVYYNAEGQYTDTNSYISGLGVDTKKLVVIEGSIVEEIIDKAEELLSVAHLHIIDSLSMCLTIDEMESDITKPERVAGSAKAWTRGLRHLNQRMDKEEHAFILVDQIRDVIGGPPGSTPKPPGGKLVDHASSLNLEFRKGAWLYRKENGILHPDGVKSKTMSGVAEADGVETVVRVAKSRVCRPFRTARLRIDFQDGTYDMTDEYVNAAIYYGIAEKDKGTWYVLPDGQRVNGAPGLASVIRENAEIQTIIRQTLKERW